MDLKFPNEEKAMILGGNAKGFDWAYEFDYYIYESILNKNHEKILKFNEFGNIARLAVPTPDHFYPLLYVLGASYEDDKISVYNKSCELGH